MSKGAMSRGNDTAHEPCEYSSGLYPRIAASSCPHSRLCCTCSSDRAKNPAYICAWILLTFTVTVSPSQMYGLARCPRVTGITRSPNSPAYVAACTSSPIIGIVARFCCALVAPSRAAIFSTCGALTRFQGHIYFGACRKKERKQNSGKKQLSRDS